MSTQSRFMYIFLLTLPASNLYSSSTTALSSRNATSSSTTTLVARALARPKANQQLTTYKYSGSTQAALKERAATQRTHCVQVKDVSNAPAYTVQEPTDEQETKRSREAELQAIIRQQQQELEEARAALKAAQDEKKAKEKKQEEQSLEQLYQEVNDVYINAANAFENDVARKKAKEEAQAKEAKAKEDALRTAQKKALGL